MKMVEWGNPFSEGHFYDRSGRVWQVPKLESLDYGYFLPPRQLFLMAISEHRQAPPGACQTDFLKV